MTAERWQEIEAILDEVMGLAGDERQARLDQLCEGDDILRKDVEEMLGFCDEVESASFLESPPHLAPDDLRLDLMAADFRETDFEAGAVIDAYTIVERLDGGGMGDVYVAERREPYKRVALKVVKRGMDTREILQRFRYEREILARLEHPNIAQLLDGGVTPDGRPYFVMEYVEGGQPIDRYCDDNGLSIRARLELFTTVCEAVRYAHRNLVVHRDLKPGNILVTEDATGRRQVKLLDFGIAKLLEEDQHLSTVPMTEAGARRMTPYYAAPEQVVGAPTTTATDVYALGVILYRLLTGHRPYEFKDRLDIEDVIRYRYPDRPSTVVQRPLRRNDTQTAGEDDVTVTPEELGQRRAVASPRMLRRQLSGDLDAITLMALRKEPERRYASAAEFLSDVRRYLDHRPVKAQPDAIGYRVGKFVQRHTAGVSITLAMVLLITTLVTVFTVRLTVERNRAEQAAERAITTRDFMVGTFAMADPEMPDPQAALDEQFTKRELIQANLSRIDELSNPLDRAEVSEVMGQVSLSYGLFDQADSLYRQALQIRIEELGPTHPDLAESLYGLGQVAYNRNRNGEADSLYHRALGVLHQPKGDKRRLVTMIQKNIAFVMGRLDSLEAAEIWYGRALSNGAVLLTEKPDDKELLLVKAANLRGLATVFRKQNRLDEAEGKYREALDLLDGVLGQNHPEVANTMYGLANVLKDKKEYSRAEEYHVKALAINREVYSDKHLAVGHSLAELAQLYHYYLQDEEKAASYYLQAINVYQSAVDSMYLWKAYPLTSLARLFIRQNNFERAKSLLEESLKIYQYNNIAEVDSRVAEVKIWLGISLYNLSQYEKAEQYLLQNYEVLKDEEGMQNWMISTLKHLLKLSDAWQKPDKVATYRTELDSLQGYVGAQER